MSLSLVIAGIISLVSLVLGAFAGHARGKSVGKVEGTQAAQQEQQITQAQETVKAVQERSSVDKTVAATPRADIDRELSEFSRPD